MAMHAGNVSSDGEDSPGLTEEQYSKFCAHWKHFDTELEWALPEVGKQDTQRYAE
jgi:hypothetical protein